MLDYYKEQLELCEMKVSLAKEGYEKKMRDLSESLKNAQSVVEAELLIDNIRLAKKALTDVEKERDHIKQRYEEEYAKPENTQKRAKEVLFGGAK